MTIGERDFGRLEGKVDRLLEELGALRRDCEHFDGRLRRLEESHAHGAGRDTARQSAIAIVVSAVVGVITAWVSKHFA